MCSDIDIKEVYRHIQELKEKGVVAGVVPEGGLVGYTGSFTDNNIGRVFKGTVFDTELGALLNVLDLATEYLSKRMGTRYTDPELITITCRCKDCNYSSKEGLKRYCHYWKSDKGVSSRLVEDFDFCSNARLSNI